MRIFIFSVLVILFCSCEKKKEYWSVLEDAEHLMALHPDSSLYLLQGINVDIIQEQAGQAKYALLLSESLDKNMIDLTSDSIIKPAVTYYSNNGTRQEKAKMYYYWGRIYENAQNLEGAIKAFTLASEWVDKKDHKLRGLIYSHTGTLYDEQLNYGQALQMHQMATKEYYKVGDIRNEGYSLSSEGWALYMLQDFDTALGKCEKSFEIAKELRDTAQILAVSRYISSIFCFNDKNTKKAKKFLNQVYTDYTNGIVPEIDYAMWGYIHLKDGNYNIANNYLSKMQVENDPHILIGYYDLKALLEEEQKNYKEALRLIKISKALSDSAYSQEKKTLIQDLERKYQTQFIQDSYDNLKIKQYYQIVIASLAIILIVIIAMLIIRRVLREKKKREKKIEEYQEFINNLHENYEQIQEKYNNLTNRHGQKLNTFRKVLESRLISMKNLMEIASTSGENVDLFLKKFKKYILIESGNKQKLFSNLQELVNLHYADVIDYLKKEYPKLNIEDLDLCCLIYLQIPVSGIQLIYNYTNMDSLYNRRYRIRQKMGIPSGINLEQYLEQLLAKHMQLSFEIDD